MRVMIQYENSGRTVTREIEFDGPEAELITHWNDALRSWAVADNRFRAEGGTNADLQTATGAVPPA